MRKIWFGLVFIALMIPTPALAQGNNKDIIDCVKANRGIRVVTSDPRQFRWYFPNEALNMRYMDCVGRKAAVAPATPAKRPRRVRGE
jgi:hypothetical protein